MGFLELVILQQILKDPAGPGRTKCERWVWREERKGERFLLEEWRAWMACKGWGRKGGLPGPLTM